MTQVTPSNPAAAPPSPAELESQIQRIGGELLQQVGEQRGGLMSRAFWSQKLIDWAMKDEAFKVQLFRFVDTFPTLRTPAAIHDHLADY
ncbi:MAG: hypothetical protein V3S08_09145, partial [Phycisphaerales bacterium]